MLANTPHLPRHQAPLAENLGGVEHVISEQTTQNICGEIKFSCVFCASACQ